MLQPEESSSSQDRSIQPFLKWAGGKTQLLSELSRHFPRNYRRYFEPFVGGGAVFFWLKPKGAILSDANFELIKTYRVVANSVEELINRLEKYQKLTLTEDLYYDIRDRFNQGELSDVEKAAGLIFLNKTCYNGLYRVNKEGLFNVPFGKYDKMPRLFDHSNLRAASALLRTTKAIKAEYFLPVLREFSPENGDFVYLDPPYAIENSNGFTGYTKEVFTWSEQEKLAKEFSSLAEKGCYVMVSNADEEKIWELYEGVAKEIIPVKAGRMINSVGSQRTGYGELIILSYPSQETTLKAWMRE